MTGAALTDGEIARLRLLLDGGEIRKLRLLCSQPMDAGRREELAELFTEDAVGHRGPFGEWRGRATIRANFAEVDRGAHRGVPVHAMHSNSDHWVEVTGPESARGRAQVIDAVTEKAPQDVPIVVIGVNDETDRKVRGAWQIERCTVQILWPDEHVTSGFDEPFGPARGST